MRSRYLLGLVVIASVLALLTTPTAAVRSAGVAPGFPGDSADWRSADKQVFATAYGADTSRVWVTGHRGVLSEVFYPNLSTPALRELDFAVLDRQGRATKVSTGANHAAVMRNFAAPMVRFISTSKDRSWRLTMDVVTDPSRPTVLVAVYLQSRDGKPRTLVALADPALNNEGSDDNGAAGSSTASAYEFDAAVTMQAVPNFTKTSVGFVGASDGWTDIARDGKVDWRYTSTDFAGNIALTGVLPLDGLHSKHATIALGFGDSLRLSRRTAQASLLAGSGKVARAFQSTWQRYFTKVVRVPSSLKTTAEKRAYRVSAMVLAASEDKDNPGAFIASPSLPWAWGTNSSLNSASAGYHQVWARDEYQMATALAAMGDKAAAVRAVRFLFDVQQKTNGGFPQNSSVDGVPSASGVQLDQVALPIILAHQLGVTDATTWSQIKSAADYIIGFKSGALVAPASAQERWEEQPGYSPSTIAAQIAAFVCAADVAGLNNDDASQTRYLAKADEWKSKINTWTVNPGGGKPYFIRLSPDGDANAATKYNIGNGGGTVDQRNVIDAGFLEFVRLGVLAADNPVVRNSLRMVDSKISRTINGHTYYYRYTKDGYGEDAEGRPWSIGGEGLRGRLWPLLSGERGEYALLAGQSASKHLAAMAAAAGPTYLIPEQVWDTAAPAGAGGPKPGSPTGSAAPLAWSHAQFVRLAWGMAKGAPVEYPTVVGCHFLKRCPR